MNTSEQTIREQLSAWMDGELPAGESRFLERRLANDPELRRHYQRMQLASSCLKGHVFRPMPAGLASSIVMKGPVGSGTAAAPLPNNGCSEMHSLTKRL